VLRLRAEHGCIAHEQYLEKLRRGVKAVQLGDELGFRRSLAAETRRQTDVLSKGTTILEVASANELASTPMWLQGDVSWSTEENTRKRQQLRQDGPVRELLQKFWEAAQRSLQQASGCDHSDSLHYEGYAQLFRRVYRLVIEEYDDADVEASISEDWLDDTRGLSSLHRESFCDAVFQVADMWTDGISSMEYCEFLSRLFDKVTIVVEERGTDGAMHTVHYIWKDLKQVSFDGSFSASSNGRS